MHHRSVQPDLSHDGGLRNRRAYLYAALVVGAWFAYVWLGVRLIHIYHAEMVRVLDVEFALLTQASIASVLAICLAFALRTGPRTLRGVISISVWMGLIVVGHYVAFMQELSAEQILKQIGLDRGVSSLLVLAGIYVVLLAIPFVPGIELGLVIIALYGAPGAVAVYAATNVGLNAAFFAGRTVRRFSISLDKLGLQMTELATTQAGSMRTRGIPGRLFQIRPKIEEYRYLLLAVLLNLPGNSVVGGGGGISVLCGMSRQFSWKWFLVAIAIATCPIPLLISTGILSAEVFP